MQALSSVPQQGTKDQWHLNCGLSRIDENVLLAGYAWNAAPIDGTTIVRSFAAKKT
jgi:hypothetical protein